MSTQTVPKLRDSKWVAEVFGLTEQAVTRKARRGEIPATRLGPGQWRFDEQKILDHIEKNTTCPK